MSLTSESGLLDFVNFDDPEFTEAASVLTALAEVFTPQIPDLPSGESSAGLTSGPLLPTAETKYRTLIEQIPALVFMAFLDRGLGEAYVSPQIETLLGFTQEEWLDDPVRWYRQIYPADKSRWSVDAARFLTTGDPLRANYRVLAKDGHVVWLQCEAKMIRKQGGEPWFIHGVAFDVTELKRAEEAIREARDKLDKRVQERTAELKEANLELARSNAELEQFAYIASHDLQEPLRAIISFADLLAARYDGKLDSKADRYIHFIVDGAQRMKLLISDLLAYSRAGSTQKPFELVHMDTVLDRALENLRVSISETQATITQDGLPTVFGDALLLTELLQNLISNAIKFRGSNRPQINVSAKTAGREWVFSVSDNGIGIDPKHRERIFVIFQRLHTRDEYQGTGIGLALCKKIVERHGGRIWVESQVGAGSTFFFTLIRRA